MQKYLTQHRLNAFTIKLPRNLNGNYQTIISIENESLQEPERLLFNSFARFIQANYKQDFNNLPPFNFLLVFYNVHFIRENEKIIVFQLSFNELLNQNIWLRLKHTIFNQYNSLLGFSQVINKLDGLDENVQIVYEQIYANAREMFKDMKLVMEFEQARDFNFVLDSHRTEPFEYLSSLLRHRSDEQEMRLDYHKTASYNILINIESLHFKTSLNLLFDMLKEMGDLVGNLQLSVKNFCHLKLAYKNRAIDNIEFIREINLFNDFFKRGINIAQINMRIFYLFYIKLIAEKLGGEFSVESSDASDCNFLVEWIFPYEKLENIDELVKDKNSLSENLRKNIVKSKSAEHFPDELLNEIKVIYTEIDGTYVLDDWKIFSDKLEALCLNYKIDNNSELQHIVKNIRLAVNGFDVSALQMMAAKIKQISKT